MVVLAEKISLLEAERQLLRLLRGESAEDIGEDLRALRFPDDIIAIAEAARSHALAPALWQRLKPWSDALPAEVREALEASYWQTAARNTLLYHELGRVLACLKRHDVRVLVLKGAALAEAVYENIALRPMGDVDLLLPKEALQGAIAALQTLGYRADLREEQPGFAAEYENEVALAHDESGMALELHWHLIDAAFYLQRIPEAALWEHAVPITIGGQATEIFDPQATLVYLCAHWVLHHQGRNLRWLYDLDLFLRRHQADLDWPQAWAIAQAWSLVLPTQQAVGQCLAWMDTPLPETARRQLEALSASAQERRAFAYLTSPQRDVISRFWGELVMMQGLRHTFRYLWHCVFPSRDYMAKRYNVPEGRALWPYYLLRVVKGVWQAARSLAASILVHARMAR